MPRSVITQMERQRETVVGDLEGLRESGDETEALIEVDQGIAHQAAYLPGGPFGGSEAIQRRGFDGVPEDEPVADPGLLAGRGRFAVLIGGLASGQKNE